MLVNAKIGKGIGKNFGWKKMALNDLGAMLNEFIAQSQRVLNVTHKPAGPEFKQIAISTGIGIAVVGIIGFLIHMFANLAKGL